MFHSSNTIRGSLGQFEVIRGFVIKLKFTKDFKNATEMLQNKLPYNGVILRLQKYQIILATTKSKSISQKLIAISTSMKDIYKLVV